jgi:RNA polymerase sigma factor FliA
LARPPDSSTDPPEVLARVKDAMDLVGAIVEQLRRQLSTALPRDELASYGHEGLLAAARTFDASRGVPFRAWAALRIRGTILDGLRSQGSMPRRIYRALRMIESADRFQDAALEEAAARPAPMTAEEADSRVSAHLAGMATAMALGLIRERTREGEHEGVAETLTPEEIVREKELLDAVRDAALRLPEPERTLALRHFFDGMGLEEVAAAQGLSKSWASRLLARAVEGLTRDLRRSGHVKR